MEHIYEILGKGGVFILNPLDYGDIYKYLEENHIMMDLEEIDDFKDLSIMDDDLEGRQIFLVGENHGVLANEQLRMKFLKYFKLKTNFKYYLWELPFSVAFFLNRYLETGDEKILREIYEPLKGTFAWNREGFNHWKELYQFNTKLPTTRKIKIIGIDIEHQIENAFKYMLYVLPEIDDTKDILKKIKKLSKDAKGEEIIEFCKGLKGDMEKRDGFYKKHLKENYYGFEIVNDNLLSRYRVYHGNNFNAIRDKQMYENFIRIHNRLPTGKYYGQLGLSHVFQRGTPYVRWFGSALISNESMFQDKVLSIVYVYDNCEYLYPTDLRDYQGVMTTLDLKLDMLKKYAKGECTLFKLNGNDSPFDKKLLWPIVHKIPEGGVTTDYFQYIILIRNSKALTSLKK